MAKLTGPLLSISASGTIAGTQTYASWKGVQYARQTVTPANPQTEAQTEVRSVFAFLNELYKRMPSIGKEPWVAAATGRPVTDRNLIISTNVPILRSETDLSEFVASIGARGGLPPTGLVVSAPTTSGTLQAVVYTPQAPSGWTLKAIQAMIMRSVDPHSMPEGFPVATEYLSPPTGSSVTLTFPSLQSGKAYAVSVWTRWETPSGAIAYGASLTRIGTPN